MGFFYTQRKTPMLEASGFCFSNSHCAQKGKVSMPESITVIIKFVEAIMDKYGFWKVTFIIIVMIIAWKSPELVSAIKS